VTVCAPAAENDTDAVAVPLALVPVPVRTAAVPVTVPVPIVVAPDLNVTVPVGPTPLLDVAIVAVKVTAWPTATFEALGATTVVVGAVVIVIESAGDVLAVKLLSPEYVATKLCVPPASCTGWSSANPRLLSLVVLLPEKSFTGEAPSFKVTVPVGQATAWLAH
jgi:hypothetical protein